MSKGEEVEYLRVLQRAKATICNCKTFTVPRLWNKKMDPPFGVVGGGRHVSYVSGAKFCGDLNGSKDNIKGLRVSYDAHRCILLFVIIEFSCMRLCPSYIYIHL